MPGDFLFRVLLGHFVGDYLLQNNWMALNKKDSILPCIVHCFLYTSSICLFILHELLLQQSTIIIIVIAGIFLSHYVIDQTNIIDKYLDLIRGRSWENTGYLIKKSFNMYSTPIAISYAAIVQTLADNTVHILIMYYLFMFTMHF